METREPGNPVRKTLALLGAFCLFLSAVEYMIPKPLPFMRTGIANLPIMMALDVLPFPSFMVLAGIKVAGQALVSGTLFSYMFLFSLAGVTLSALSMRALKKVFAKNISFVGLGVAGAMVSNMSQLALAWLFVFGNNVRFIAPPFLGSGLVSGLALGVFCEYFTRHSKWYEQHRIR